MFILLPVLVERGKLIRIQTFHPKKILTLNFNKKYVLKYNLKHTINTFIVTSPLLICFYRFNSKYLNLLKSKF